MSAEEQIVLLDADPEPVAKFESHIGLSTRSIYEFSPRVYPIFIYDLIDIGYDEAYIETDDEDGDGDEYEEETTMIGENLRRVLLPQPWIQIHASTMGQHQCFAVTCSPESIAGSELPEIYTPFMPNNSFGSICSGVYGTNIAEWYASIWNGPFSQVFYVPEEFFPDQAQKFIVDYDHKGWYTKYDSKSVRSTIDWEAIESVSPEEMCEWNWSDVPPVELYSHHFPKWKRVK